MAGAIAHHINNKLTAVLGYLDLAAFKMDSGGDARDHIRDGIEAAQQASWIGKLMLDYLGHGFHHRELVDVGALCLEVFDAVRVNAQEGVRLLTDLPDSEDGPLAIVADVGDMKRVLENLLQNALEEITGKGEVRLSMRKVPAGSVTTSLLLAPGWTPVPGYYVCLEVTDNGPGMTPEVLQNASDPFFTTKFAGRGLGLPVVLGIVQAHGGTVSVETTPGHGSTFRVFLPLKAILTT